jgi:putative tryptophan/tyrosine transport system substrate-binding protein
MRRIGLAVVLAVSLLIAPLAAVAQQSAKIARIGILSSLTAEETAPFIDVFRQGLRRLGYVEGQNVALEMRYADAKLERLPGLAAELVRLKVDVIVARPNPSIAAAQKATTSIPIVMTSASDPVATGFVASLPQPGGNITGLSNLGSPEFIGKGLQLLKDVVPSLSRVAVLWDSGFQGIRHQLSGTQAAAQVLGVQLQLVEVRSAADLDGAFAAATRNRAGAAYIFGSTMTFHNRARIGELAVTHRLPALCGALREWAQAGCLIAYGPSATDQMGRAAYFVDKILKGAKPADLPVEQATKFELIINLKTAKALGLTIPPSVLLRADQVIE